MDDVLCRFVALSMEKNSDELVAALNNMFLTIKFITKFGGKIIDFLDLDHSTSIGDDYRTFRIHMKPTCTDIEINDLSLFSASYEDAAFYSLVHRRTFIPLILKEIDK